MKLSFVIPAYNEEDGIAKTLKTIPVKALTKAGYTVETLVVDNDSTDKTAAIAKANGARVIREPKRGYGNAYKAGFDHATGDIIITGDADATYPFDALPKLLPHVLAQDLHFVSTDRLTNLHSGVMSRMHLFGNRLLSRLMRLLFRAPYHDSQSGMWIFRRNIWPHLEVTHNGMPFSQELKIEAHIKGFRCGELPIEYRPRLGHAKLSYTDAFRTMFQLFKKRLFMQKYHVPRVRTSVSPHDTQGSGNHVGP